MKDERGGFAAVGSRRKTIDERGGFAAVDGRRKNGPSARRVILERSDGIQAECIEAFVSSRNGT